VDATCVQFGSRGERIPPSKEEEFPRYMGHIDDCISGGHFAAGERERRGKRKREARKGKGVLGKEKREGREGKEGKGKEEGKGGRGSLRHWRKGVRRP